MWFMPDGSISGGYCAVAVPCAPVHIVEGASIAGGVVVPETDCTKGLEVTSHPPPSLTVTV